MFLVQELSASLKCVPILVINYKPLNKVLDDNTYVIPHKSSLVNRIAGAQIFSKFDLKSGFWQVAVKEEDKFKTAFSVPVGHYEWNVMPFSLNNAPNQVSKSNG